MKNFIRVPLLALFLLSTSYASAKIIVNYTKIGGGLFGYKYVSSTYIGEVNGDDWYDVQCEGHGFNRCKRTLGSAPEGTGLGNPRNVEILTKVDEQISSLLDKIDEDIKFGRRNGAHGTKVHLVMSDGTETLVVIKAQWRYDKKRDESNVQVIVDEVGSGGKL